jgi:hypothetical protein
MGLNVTRCVTLGYLKCRAYGTQNHCVTTECYLKCRAYGTQNHCVTTECYLKCRPDGTQCDAVRDVGLSKMSCLWHSKV